MSPNLTLREATLDDAATVATLFSEFNAILGADGLPNDVAFLPEHVGVPPERMAARLRGMQGIETTLLAELDSEAAGLACLRLVPYIGQDAPYAELTQLYVRERCRRRGVATALLRAVEQRAIAAGATCLAIITGRDNTQAQAFYRAMGYESEAVLLTRFFAPATREAAHA